MSGPGGEVIARRGPVEQGDRAGEIDRTVAAVDVPLEFGARTVAAHTDLVPAILDVRAGAVQSDFLSSVHVRPCASLPHGGRARAMSVRLPCYPASPSR